MSYPSFLDEDIKGAITDLVLKIIENDPSQYIDAVKSLEDVLKDLGLMGSAVKDYVKANIPAPPTPPEEQERRAQVAAELQRLEEEEKARELIKRLQELKKSDPAAYKKEMAEIKASGGVGGISLDQLVAIKAAESGLTLLLPPPHLVNIWLQEASTPGEAPSLPDQEETACQ